MRIVFFGSGAFGLPTLRRLARAHDVLGVVTQPDRPAGRGTKLTPTPVGAWAAEHLPAVPLLKPDRVNEPETRDLVRSWPADAWVVIAFGQKLSPALLADRFAVNLHASLLPRWRGAAPINHAVLAGDAETGNSVITLADRMDAGLVLARSRRVIGPDQTAGELHDLLAEDGPALVERVLQDHARDALTPETQDESLVTLAGKLSRADARVDWDEPADRVRARINGLSPWPGVTVAAESRPLKLLRAQPGPPVPQQATPGEIVDPGAGVVACAPRQSVVLLEVQPAGGRPMPFADWANGRNIRPGLRLEPAGAPA